MNYINDGGISSVKKKTEKTLGLKISDIIEHKKEKHCVQNPKNCRKVSASFSLSVRTPKLSLAVQACNFLNV